MATQRRSGAKRAKAAGSKKKAAPRPKRAAAKRSAGKKRAAKKPRPAKRTRPVKAAAKPRPARAGAPLRKAKAATAKPPKPGAKAAPAQVALRKSARAAAEPKVRPLGVLPPRAIARGVARSATRPMPGRATAARPPAAKPPRPGGAVPGAPGAPGVTEEDYKDFETRLLDERRKVLKEMGHLETTVLKVNPRDSAGDLSAYSFHMADAGTDAMEREKAFMFASAEGRLLMEIDEALRRLFRGEYGLCESCGNAIARARLEAVPYARLCVPCKEKEERANPGAM